MRYLSDDWLRAAADALAAADAPLPHPADISIQQTVTGTPDGDRSYAIVISGRSVDLLVEGVEEPSVTFTQSWDTARHIAQGSLSAQSAFMSGHMKVGGNTNLLLEHHDLLTEVDDLLADVRSETSFDA